MKILRQLCFTYLTFFIPFSLNGQSPVGNDSNPYAVATYECGSIYWKTPQAGECKIRYREAGKNSWQEGLDLVYDSRQGEYRGSI
ncbi:MAG TPA: hypothetical protein VKZ51_01125, partial [Cyclobacteriaceae bacterium]|nr:hypothetical protein [Cyclobacteriaceae bacterium]